jgi:hypothetical protein
MYNSRPGACSGAEPPGVATTAGRHFCHPAIACSKYGYPSSAGGTVLLALSMTCGWQMCRTLTLSTRYGVDRNPSTDHSFSLTLSVRSVEPTVSIGNHRRLVIDLPMSRELPTSLSSSQRRPSYLLPSSHVLFSYTLPDKIVMLYLARRTSGSPRQRQLLTTWPNSIESCLMRKVPNHDYMHRASLR